MNKFFGSANVFDATANHNVWLHLPEGKTIVYPLQRMEDMFGYLQHFDYQHKFFIPCIGSDNGCVGCKHHIPKRPKGILAVADVDRQPRLLEFNKRLYSKLKEVDEKLGESFVGMKLVITRQGQGLDTTYTVTHGFTASIIDNVEVLNPLDYLPTDPEYLHTIYQHKFNGG